MKEHYWIRSRFHPQGLGEKLSGPIQSWECENCGTLQNLPDAMMPTDYIQSKCSGERPKVAWKAPLPEKSSYEETRDYPAKSKKRIKSKGVRR